MTLSAQLAAPNGITPGDETRMDTERIQKAIDDCGHERAVELVRDGYKTAFLIGPINLKKGVTLLVERGVTVYGSRDPHVYDVHPGTCGLVDSAKKWGCKPLINVKRASNSAIMGDGTIDGRGGAKLLVLGSQESSKSWWDLAEDARKSGHQQVPRLIQTDHTDNFTLYKITLKNSANVHVAFHHGDGLTVWGIKIDTPKNARNADGIDPSSAKNITVADSYIRAGDDNIALKAGDGSTKNVSVLHNHFYWGHGMSIGSETNGGVSNVLVSDLSVDGADNGLRIKSSALRGGLVHEVLYNDVCVRKSKAPITLETAYPANGDLPSKDPVYTDIVMKDVRISGGGKIQLMGFDETHRIGIQFDGVVLADPNGKYKFMANHTDLTMGPGPVNFQMVGEDSTLRGAMATQGTAPAAGCEAKFVPFPTPVTEATPTESAAR
jgi:polygalacturonase